jgi:hypothetical protein
MAAEEHDMETLVCRTCGESLPTPRHCGRATHVEQADGRDVLVCWMGAGCGVKDIPEHCGAPMTSGE